MSGEKCPRCRDDGFYFRLPNGMNPFLMGAIRAAEASIRVECWCEAGKERRARAASTSSGGKHER